MAARRQYGTSHEYVASQREANETINRILPEFGKVRWEKLSTGVETIQLADFGPANRTPKLGDPIESVYYFKKNRDGTVTVRVVHYAI